MSGPLWLYACGASAPGATAVVSDSAHEAPSQDEIRPSAHARLSPELTPAFVEEQRRLGRDRDPCNAAVVGDCGYATVAAAAAERRDGDHNPDRGCAVGAARDL